MKTTTRKYYLLPLMAVTALSLSLAACDDKAENEAANTETVIEAPVAAETIAPEVAVVAAAVQAQGATAYATAEGSTNGAVFLTLHNAGTVADKLIGATTPVATSVELHQNATDANGVVTMNKVDAIEVPAGQQVVLSADGYHIMLMGLTAPLVEGTPFDVTLDFESAPDVILPVTVTAPTAAAPMDHTGHIAPPAETTTTTTTTTTVDESPAPADTVAPTDEPAPATDMTTAPAADAPVDEQPVQ